MNRLFGASRGWFDLGTPGDALATATTIAAVAAGAALIETALVPALAIGAAAVLAPRIARMATSQVTAALRRAPQRPAAAAARAGAAEAAPADEPGFTLQRLRPGRALMKTVTFRLIVTTLDFSVNYFVLGEVTTAAGLSAFSLISGPVFYFLHETGWDYFGARGQLGQSGDRIVLLGLPMSRAIGKTITYRIVATTAEFTATYVIVQDLATAALLSSFGFVLGPFVYFAHERAWEVFGGPDTQPAPAPAPVLRLAAPA